MKRRRPAFRGAPAALSPGSPCGKTLRDPASKAQARHSSLLRHQTHFEAQRQACSRPPQQELLLAERPTWHLPLPKVTCGMHMHTGRVTHMVGVGRQATGRWRGQDMHKRKSSPERDKEEDQPDSCAHKRRQQNNDPPGHTRNINHPPQGLDIPLASRGQHGVLRTNRCELCCPCSGW